MKKYLLNSLAGHSAMIFCLLFYACAPKQDDRQIAESVLSAYQKALSSQSASLVANSFHEDAVILAEGKEPIHGRAAITQHFSWIETVSFQGRFDIEDIQSAGEHLIVRTKNTGSWEDVSGQSTSFVVKGLMVMDKDLNGVWKIKQYAYSNNGSASKKIKGNFVHIVLFWVKDGMNDRFEKSLNNFISQSKYAASYHVGMPAITRRPIIDHTYSYCLLVTFDTKKEHDAYQDEGVHKAFIEEVGDTWYKIKIYDSNALQASDK